MQLRIGLVDVQFLVIESFLKHPQILHLNPLFHDIHLTVVQVRSLSSLYSLQNHCVTLHHSRNVSVALKGLL